MSHPVIEADECIGCGICVDACPQEVLEVVGGTADVVNEEAGLGGGIVAQTREATGGIGGAGTGGSRYVGLAGTMGHGFFREPINQ